MEPESLLPCSQEPSTGPYPKANQSSLYCSILISIFKKLRGLSPRANYTDRRLSVKLVETFSGQGVPCGQRDGTLRPCSRISRPA
jgi:hypothetical protein